MILTLFSSHRVKNIVFSMKATLIGQLSLILPDENWRSFRRLFRSVTSSIGVMSKFGCIVSRALKNGSKDSEGSRWLLWSMRACPSSFLTWCGRLGGFHLAGHPANHSQSYIVMFQNKWQVTWNEDHRLIWIASVIRCDEVEALEGHRCCRVRKWI